MFLAVLATTPPVDSSLSLVRRLSHLCDCCSVPVVPGCGVGFRFGKQGVYSDREKAEEGGNITAIDIEETNDGIISSIQLR